MFVDSIQESKSFHFFLPSATFGVCNVFQADTNNAISRSRHSFVLLCHSSLITELPLFFL